MLKRRAFWIGAALAALALQVAAVPASAAQHFGGYASGSPDSGTCGNNWANDTYNRNFTVQSNPDGTLTVIEEFKDGVFTTVAGASPGGCDTNPGGTVAAGVTGSLHGYFIIPLPAQTQISMDASCVAGNPSADCTTTGFINSHFAPACYPDLCPVTTFLFNYSAGNPALSFHEWKNASADRGGNSGDIAS
jgi:hypothetical protein